MLSGLVGVPSRKSRQRSSRRSRWPCKRWRCGHIEVLGNRAGNPLYMAAITASCFPASCRSPTFSDHPRLGRPQPALTRRTPDTRYFPAQSLSCMSPSLRQDPSAPAFAERHPSGPHFSAGIRTSATGPKADGYAPISSARIVTNPHDQGKTQKSEPPMMQSASTTCALSIPHGCFGINRATL